MTNKAEKYDSGIPEEIAENPGMRAAAIHSDPTISLEEARNAAAGEAPNAAGSVADSTVEGHVPSTSDPYPTDIPSTDHPLPDDDDDVTAGASNSFSDETDDRYVH
ncbi:hypothetical protein [Leptolyngbya sp. 7M]|uniref:hypothetical protein n=1 Tax=Leptolyngbya sp. 7M TaxID=2812896 RepID=UPI001B8C7D48|nr:hypothetical protein [Leptolyngbya sp. 7M]QYO63456.1 hypothetical protein JVX88_26695 [Leptolyngbya sp. 7M]